MEFSMDPVGERTEKNTGIIQKKITYQRGGGECVWRGNYVSYNHELMIKKV